MRVRFWGARGSIPTPMSEAELQDKIRTALTSAVGVDLHDRAAVDEYIARLPASVRSTAGGNTSCVEVRAGDSVFIMDCGSGMRSLGIELMKSEFGKGRGIAHIFITHSHWDHVQGLPFFNPAFVPGNQLNFHSPYPDLQMRFEDQQREIYFPVPLEYARAARTWHVLDPNQTYDIAGVQVSLTLLSHPGGAYAYRLIHNGKIFVFATDGEYYRMDAESTAHYVEFFKGADLLVFDAQYPFDQAIDSKRDWGHSTPKMGAELAFRAGVKQLALFHHDPLSSDERLWEAVNEAYHHLSVRARSAGILPGTSPLTSVLLASEGLVVEL